MLICPQYKSQPINPVWLHRKSHTGFSILAKEKMAGITLATAEAKLAEYLAAETAVLSGQSYSIAGRSLTRADLQFIQTGITQWDARVKKLDRGGNRVWNGVPE